MADPVRILTVCTGNVCRSPYIERRLQQELDRVWGAGWVAVRSAGSGALVGEGMDRSALTLLSGKGVHGRDFRARALVKDMVAEADLVITATRQHRAAVTRLYPRSLSTTHALLDLAHLADAVTSDELPTADDARTWFGIAVPILARKRGLRPPLQAEEADIVDPFGQGPEVFEDMQEQIEDALPRVLRVLGPDRSA